MHEVQEIFLTSEKYKQTAN